MSNICFIGGGNMATSLIGGLIAQGHPADSIVVSDPNELQRTQLEQQFSIRTTINSGSALKDADVVVLAVKPQIMKSVALSIAAEMNSADSQNNKQQPLFVSIAAGINLKSLQLWLGESQAIVRCKPLAPC